MTNRDRPKNRETTSTWSRPLRHAALAVVLLGGVLAASPAVGRFLLERSDSSGLNLLILSGLMALVLVGSYGFAAALLGTLWPARFIGGTLQGDQPRARVRRDEDEDASDLRPRPRARTRPLALALVAVALGTILLGNQLADGAFFRQREVLYRSALRSSNVSLKIRILREIADSGQREVLVAFMPVIWQAQSAEKDAAAREAMLWTLAELAERMRKSVLIRHTAMELQGWEQELLEDMRASLTEGMVALLRQDEPALLRPAFRALLHLDAERAVEMAGIYVNHPRPDAAVQLDIAYLLAQSGLLKATDVLSEMLSVPEAKVRTAATIGQARLLRLFKPERDGVERPEFARFTQRLMGEVRSREPSTLCPVLEALEYVKDARFGQALMALFDDASLRGKTCPPMVLKDHLGREDVLVRDEGVPLMVLRALSQIAVGNPPVESFLKARVDHPDFVFLRGEIRNVLLMIEKAGQEEAE